MENTVNKRILLLKSELSLNDIEFCGRASISTATLFKVKNDEEISQRVLNAIISAFNVNKEWLVSGKGKMFVDANKVEATTSNPWKDALIAELKEEVTYYRELLKMMAGGKAANFLKASENAYTFKMFPGSGTLKSVSGAMLR